MAIQDRDRARSTVGIEVRPVGVLLTLIGIAVVLVSAHYVGDLVAGDADSGARGVIGRLTDLNDESSVSTWYSSGLLLAVAVVAWMHVRYAEQDRRIRWYVLAAVFAFLSIDEATSIHETADALHDLLGIETATTFLWTVPYSLLVIVLAVSFYRFFLALPPATRRLFIAAAALYLGGALGLEILAAGFRELGWDTAVTDILIPVEEGLEMLGTSVFIYALLDLLVLRSRTTANSSLMG